MNALVPPTAGARWFTVAPALAFAVAAAFVVATLCAAQAQDPASVASGDAARGRALYKAVGCYGCHGLEGQGSIVSGPRIAPGPAPLPLFTQLLRQPRNVMPPYTAKVLSEQDIADIHAFLAGIPQPAGASP